MAYIQLIGTCDGLRADVSSASSDAHGHRQSGFRGPILPYSTARDFASIYRPWKPVERFGSSSVGARSSIYFELHWVESLRKYIGQLATFSFASAPSKPLFPTYFLYR